MLPDHIKELLGFGMVKTSPAKALSRERNESDCRALWSSSQWIQFSGYKSRRFDAFHVLRLEYLASQASMKLGVQLTFGSRPSRIRWMKPWTVDIASSIRLVVSCISTSTS